MISQDFHKLLSSLSEIDFDRILYLSNMDRDEFHEKLALKFSVFDSCLDSKIYSQIQDLHDFIFEESGLFDY